MAVKLTKINLISKTTGEVKEVSFPMDAGLLKAVYALQEEQRNLFLVREYYEFKREQKRQRRILSLETMLADCTEFEDGLIDDSLNPQEQCLKNKRDALLYDAIESLNGRQRKVIIEIFYHDRTQKELPDEMGISESAMSHFVDYVLAKLRNFLERKI